MILYSVLGVGKGEMLLFITPGNGTGSTFDKTVAEKFSGKIEKKKSSKRKKNKGSG